MDKSALIRFLEKAAVSAELQRDLVALAAKYGIDILDQPLPDAALEKVVGGVTEGQEYEKDPEAASADRNTRLKEALQGLLQMTYEVNIAADKYR